MLDIIVVNFVVEVVVTTVVVADDVVVVDIDVVVSRPLLQCVRTVSLYTTHCSKTKARTRLPLREMTTTDDEETTHTSCYQCAQQAKRTP